MGVVRVKFLLPRTRLQRRALSGWLSIQSKEVVRLEIRRVILEQIVPPPLLTRTHTIFLFLQVLLLAPTPLHGLGSTRWVIVRCT